MILGSNIEGHGPSAGLLFSRSVDRKTHVIKIQDNKDYMINLSLIIPLKNNDIDFNAISQ